MTTALESAISDLSNATVALPDALRRLLVVSRRIGSADLTEWLRGELNGYSGDVAAPIYRQGEHLPIKLHFDGPMHSSSTMTVTASELPERLSSVMTGMDFREPIAELEALARGEDNPELQLPMAWIALYRSLAEKEKVPSIYLHVLNRAGVMMPRTHLTGILDRVKSTALDLALSLEDLSPQVGDAGGPTVANEPRLAHEISVHLTQLFANGTTITVGDNATVASGTNAAAIRIEQGDIDGLLRAAGAFLQFEGIQALANAISSDGNTAAEATKSFLDRVKAGSYMLVGGITTNAAYDELLALLHQAFPGTFS